MFDFKNELTELPPPMMTTGFDICCKMLLGFGMNFLTQSMFRIPVKRFVDILFVIPQSVRVTVIRLPLYLPSLNLLFALGYYSARLSLLW